MWLPALISAGATLLGGAANRRSAKSQAAGSEAFQREMDKLDRTRFLADRVDERAYVDRIRLQDNMRADLLRRQDRKAVVADRQRDRKWAVSDRNNERAYAQGMDIRDRRLYEADRERMQALADAYVESNVASRGVDMQRMRDDAIKAGFNPLTMLSAGALSAYSTEQNKGLVGGPYQSHGLPGVGAGGVGGGGAVGGMGAYGGGAIASGGGFVSSGAGYSRDFNPALSSGSFLSEAIQRGVDTYFNTPPAVDPLADALRDAINGRAELEAREQAAPVTRSNRSFGYDLTQQRPYVPAQVGGSPALSRDANFHPPANAPENTRLKQGGVDVHVSDRFETADTYEEQYGDVGGEILTMDKLIYDFGKNMRRLIYPSDTLIERQPSKSPRPPRRGEPQYKRGWFGVKYRKTGNRSSGGGASGSW